MSSQLMQKGVLGLLVIAEFEELMRDPDVMRGVSEDDVLAVVTTVAGAGEHGGSG